MQRAAGTVGGVGDRAGGAQEGRERVEVESVHHAREPTKRALSAKARTRVPGQDSLTRSMPSWATDATSVPSAENIRPVASPRPPEADGEAWV